MRAAGEAEHSLLAGRDGFNETRDYYNPDSSDPLPRPDQGEYGDRGAFAPAGLKEIGDGGFGLVQPGGRRLSGEVCPGIVVCAVAFVLEVTEEVGEDLNPGGETGPVLLQLSASLVVVQAPIGPNPGFGDQLVLRGTDQRVGVAGSKGMERGVVGVADGSSYRCRSGLIGRSLRSQVCPPSGYEFGPADGRRRWKGRLGGAGGHAEISLLFA